MYILFIFNEIRYNYLPAFCSCVYRKYQKIDQSYADLQAPAFVLNVLSVFGEFNGILHETKHFSFDLGSIPSLQRAVK